MVGVSVRARFDGTIIAYVLTGQVVPSRYGSAKNDIKVKEYVL